MNGRDLLEAAYHANLACLAVKTACREAEGRAAPTDAPLVSQAVADEFERQTLSLNESALRLIRRVSEPKQREVLELRYLRLMSFEDIADQMNYVPRHIYNFHRAALHAIDSIS